MKGFGIYVKNDLLDPKHREKMGVAIWEYLWLLDKMTSINEEGIGKVLGGKPIKKEEIAEELGGSPETIRRNLSKLKNEGYIKVKRTPYGLQIRVVKAVKVFSNKERNNKNVVSKRNNKNVVSNKDNTAKDKTNNNILAKQSFAGINDLIEMFKEINPNYQRLFPNKTQRSALERMINSHGREKVEGAIKYATLVSGKKYAPVITTPLQLENKLGELVAYNKKQRSEKIHIEI